MSAIRYSGSIRIRVTYRDNHSDYRCFLSATTGEKHTVYVGEPAILTRAVDSPESYDDAARAALAFAESDGYPVRYARMDEHGYTVARSPGYPVRVSRADIRRQWGHVTSRNMRHGLRE